MKTIIQTRIEGEQWIATTPHCPELYSTHSTEAGAVNGLIEQIREHNAGNEPVAWIETPQVKSDDGMITRHLTGLWPVDIATTQPMKRKDPSDGN